MLTKHFLPLLHSPICTLQQPPLHHLRCISARMYTHCYYNAPTHMIIRPLKYRLCQQHMGDVTFWCPCSIQLDRASSDVLP
ncbi:hypothetical protein GDO78_019505 [Eleutherodactylus coqui]|uniref:Uncharacterized protein n=1 Tax=Eleutherodactylus coqui TaxID=57060 RepID=A0A8J6JX06_ELECQ|nr:hypothetical protein GDO78_019505 [Eleutherodactylus coqui]